MSDKSCSTSDPWSWPGSDPGSWWNAYLNILTWWMPPSARFWEPCGTTGSTESLSIDAAVGKEGTATYKIENRDFRTVKVRVAASAPLRDADGHEVNTAVKVEPSELEIGPWQCRSVEVTVKIDGDIKPDKTYSTTIVTYSEVQSAQLVVRRQKS